MRNAKKSKSCPNVKYTKLMEGKKICLTLMLGTVSSEAKGS